MSFSSDAETPPRLLIKCGCQLHWLQEGAVNEVDIIDGLLGSVIHESVFSPRQSRDEGMSELK
jgi:hypothetical protein